MRTLIVNFKNYPEIFGEGSLELAEAGRRVAGKTGVELIVAPPHSALWRVASMVDTPVFAQSLSEAPVGASTGALVAEVASSMGVRGTILNHSEAPLSRDAIVKVLAAARRAHLDVCLCAGSAGEVEKLAGLGTRYLAIEPPTLIGKGIAVSKAKPSLVTESVSRARRAGYRGRILCGAGIVSGEDAEAAVRLGVDGVLVSSSVVKAPDWEEKLTELALPLLRKHDTRK